jgi:alpha,alpha-trehalase
MLRFEFGKPILVLVALLLGLARTQTPDQASSDKSIIKYIHATWQTLSRSTNDCASLSDPKLGGRLKAVVYVPRGLEAPASTALQAQCSVRVETLPKQIARPGDIMPGDLAEPGLLYLPHPYVVPGGRFNEMYGWDSYFIIRGLIEEGEIDLARGMVENFFFEIDNYGAVLNANRTYYLTRSQPPFLTSMILAVYEAGSRANRADPVWLERAYRYADWDYRQWTTAPKLAGNTGLSRYFDIGSGPVPEIADDAEYYATVADWISRHPGLGSAYLAAGSASGTGPEFQVPHCNGAPCNDSHSVRFKTDYYNGDRAMRESGFDVSFRFGPFGGLTHHFAPVCLNSLLYKTEKDMAHIAHLLGNAGEAAQWQKRASSRRKLINRFLWNPGPGMYTDYDFYTHRRSTYHYATTFYPLWTGLATRAQAAAVMKDLKMFELPGGIAMSDRETGVQWDKPYAWAPIHLLAIEGMRRYGFGADAERITRKFLTMVNEDFVRYGTIREKYNARKRSSEVNVAAGYATNVAGFGWTNGSFLVLLHELPTKQQDSILEKKLQKSVDKMFDKLPHEKKEKD